MSTAANLPTDRVEVLIAGAGPTGMTLALFLAAAGRNVLIVDKEADIYPLPRAAHIDHEIVRVFQGLGVAEPVMATSRAVPRYDFLTADRQVLMRFDSGAELGPGGWPPANMIHQPSLERALREKLRAYPNAVLMNSTPLEGFREEGDGIVATLQTGEGQREVRADFLVGADGARSFVRTRSGIGFDDLEFDEPWLVIDTIVKDQSRLPDCNLQICDPARPTTCVLMGEGRHRWEFMIKPGEDPEAFLDDTFIAGLLAPWDVAGAVELERKAVYRFNARIAAEWRKGRVLLAGDAAHQMPPFAGQGLCSGVRDAANLGWKLPAVLDGADAFLLDTYRQERDPNVRTIIDVAIMMGRTVCVTDPAAAAERDRAMLADRASGSVPPPLSYPPPTEGCLLAGTPEAGAYFPQPVADGIRLDDVLGPGAWLIARDTVAASDTIRSESLDGACLLPFRGPLDEWLAATGKDAVLVRPDRYVFGTGDAATLIAAWHSAVAPRPIARQETVATC